MGMTILLRNDISKSPFKEALKELIEDAVGNELIISSGYLSALTHSYNDWKGDIIFPYLDFLVTSIKNAKLNNNEINSLKIIGGHFEHQKDVKKDVKKDDTGKKILIVNKKCEKVQNSKHPDHGGNCDLCTFLYGTQILSKMLINEGLVIPKLYYIKKWHAKVAYKFEGKEKIASALLIGSSNFTNPCLIELNKTGDAQHECDVYMWTGKSQYNKLYTQKELEDLTSIPVRPTVKVGTLIKTIEEAINDKLDGSTALEYPFINDNNNLID